MEGTGREGLSSKACSFISTASDVGVSIQNSLKRGKLLTISPLCINCQTAGRQSVELIFSNPAKVTGTQKNQKLFKSLMRVDWIMNSKPGITANSVRIHFIHNFRVIEYSRGEIDFLSLTGCHEV